MTVSTNYFVDYYIDIDYFVGDTEVYAEDGYAASGYVLGDSGTTTYVGGSGSGIEGSPWPSVMSPTVTRGVATLGDVTFRILPNAGELVFGANAATTTRQTITGTGIAAPTFPLGSIRLAWRKITCTGFETIAWGTPSLRLNTQFAYAKAFASTEVFGTGVVTNWRQYVTGTGKDMSTIPSPTIYNLTQYKVVGGTAFAPTFGTSQIAYAERSFSMTGWANAQAWGTSTVINRNRTFKANASLDMSSFGTTTIVLKNQPVKNATLGDMSGSFGTATVVNRDVYLKLSGIGSAESFTTTLSITNWVQYVQLSGYGLATLSIGSGTTVTAGVRYITSPQVPYTWGTGTASVKHLVPIAPSGWDSAYINDQTEVVHNTRHLYPPAWSNAQTWGQPTVWNRIQYADLDYAHQGIADESWTQPLIWNKNQYISSPTYKDNQQPDVWPDYSPVVANRKRYITTTGTVMVKFSNATKIVNKAVGLSITFPDQLAFGSTMIAPRVRYITGKGWVEFVSEEWHMVRNTRRQFYGFGGTDFTVGFGTATLVNLNRYYSVKGITTGLAWGKPLVAFRIRYLVPDAFPTDPQPKPDIRLNPAPITPKGFLSYAGGNIWLTVHKNIVYPGAITSKAVITQPVIRNKNQTLDETNNGWNSAELGLHATVQLLKRYLLPTGYEQTTFGTADISRRTKYLKPSAINGFVCLQNTLIYNVNTVVDLTQTLNDVGGTSYAPAFGEATLNWLTAYPNGFTVTAFGTATVLGNGLTPDFWEDAALGTPAVIGPQTITATGIEPDLTIPSDAQFSPFYMYAPSGDQAPSGYRPSHDTQPVISPPSMPAPMVSFFVRTITIDSDSSPDSDGLRPPGFGTATLQLRKRYLTPKGIVNNLFGVVGFLGIPQYIDGDDEWDPAGIASDVAFGDATVARPPYTGPQYISATGWDGLVFGSHVSEPFDRTRYPSGFVSTPVFGTAMVGWPRTFTDWSAGDTSVFGAATIEFLNRTLSMTGFNSCTLEDGNIDDYVDPGKITRKNPPYYATGSKFEAFGTAFIAEGNRSVGATGWAQTAFGATRMAQLISASGWLEEAFGDFPRWEYGVLKPQGFDTSALAQPRTGLTITPTWEQLAVIGSVGLAQRIATWGMPPVGFDGPVLTDENGCSRRYLAAYPYASTEAVPSPQIKETT